MMRKSVSVAAAVTAALILAGCTSGMTRAERLSLYEANAGEPLTRVTYFAPQGWEEVDSNHVLVTMRPSEAYLMRLSGPCLDYDQGAATMFFTTATGSWIQAKFDRVTFGGSSISCRIEEIRPVDLQGVRAARDQALGST